MTTIRNISQSVQEREIIKTAPDIIVYIDGLPYLENPYVNGANGQQFTLVNFNGYVSAFSASYDTDSLLPTGTVNLSVPNHMKYLFQAPGGNNLVESMSELQVMAKGYYPAADGGTLYHRVFKGVISHATHTDTGQSLEISIQAQGILRFLELMQIDLSPSLLSNSERPATPFQTNEYNLDPYQQIANQFLKGVTFEGFQYNSILQSTVQSSDFAKAAAAGYVNKWQQILSGVRKIVHIFGYTFGTVLPQDINAIAKPTDSRGREWPDKKVDSEKTVGQLLESDPSHDLYTSILRGYLPDFKIGTIKLLDGQVVSRLERIRMITNAIAMEAYQDINGDIIVKPPLYNLDVTDTTPIVENQNSAFSQDQQSKVRSAEVRFNAQNNPFIVYLSEMEPDAETEDEKGIRATRLTVQPDWLRTLHFNDASSSFRDAVWHIDIAKLAKFGLREEPAKTLPWLTAGDKVALYTYAVSELNRANRAYRTYTFTIPMRPELRLGFPMYFPHRDMYGYIRSVSLNYTVGGTSTMTVMCDTLRKRPMFPTQAQSQTTNGNPTGSGATQPTIIYTTQPNLVMKWTEPPSATPSGLPSSNPTNPVTSGNLGHPAGSSMTGNQSSSDPAVNLVGNPATQLQSTQKPVFDEQTRVVNYRRDQLGTYWGTKADTTTRSFRVQNDVESPAESAASGVPAGKPFFSRDHWLTPRPSRDDKGNPIYVTASPAKNTTSQGLSTQPSGAPQRIQKMTSGIDMTYFQRILTSQPFTDEKGYELVTPFPWGRWKTLPEAYAETRLSKLVDTPSTQDLTVLQGVDAFLFAGMGTPQGNLSPGGQLQIALQKIQNQVESGDTFEIEPSTGTQPGTESGILLTSAPDNLTGTAASSYLVQQQEQQIQARVNLFLNGSSQSSPVTQDMLDIATNNATKVGVTPTVKPTGEF